MKKSLLIIVLGLSVIFIGCKSKADRTIDIAFNMPITGDLGYLGEEVRSGLSFALTDYADSLAKYGYKVAIDYQDNQGLVKEAVTVFKKQKHRKPDMYMSGVLPQVVALADMVKKEGVPHHIWAFSPLYLKSEDNMLRTWLNLGIEADQYVHIITTRGAKKVAFIYVNILGCQQQCEEVVIPKVKEIDPTCEIVPMPYPMESTDLKNHMISLIHYLSSNNMIGERNVIGSFDLLDAAPELSAEELENITMSVPVFMTLGASDAYSEWKDRFVAKYNRIPEYTDAYAYDYGCMLVEAIRIMNEKGCQLKDALFAVDIEGITGHLQFLENGDLHIPIVLCSFKNHVLVPEN